MKNIKFNEVEVILLMLRRLRKQRVIGLYKYLSLCSQVERLDDESEE